MGVELVITELDEAPLPITNEVRRSRFLSMTHALGGFQPVIANAHIAVLRKEGQHLIHFLSEENLFTPLLTFLTQHHIIEMGFQESFAYATKQMRFVSDEATFMFVGDGVGAANALETFLHLPPDLLERVNEVHLRNFSLEPESLRNVLDVHANKVRLIQ